MIRALKFENNEISKKRFEFVFHGLFIIGNQNTQKGLSVLTREISLLDKIESISKPCECGKKIAGTDESDRELDFGADGEMVGFSIDEHEFDLLFDYIGRVPWSLGKASRSAVETLLWLKNGSQTS